MVPDKDTTRTRLWMKEKTIADCWAEAIGLSKSSKDYKKLEKYNDPTHAGMTACGDISMCVYEVVKKRFPEYDKKDGGVTVGEMNDLLDDLAGLSKAREGGVSENAASASAGGNANSKGAKKKKVKWIEKLISKKFSVS